MNPPSLPPPPRIPTPLHPSVAINIQTAAMTGLLSGEATFDALKQAIDEIRHVAPEDHDVLIHAFNITIDEVGFIEPHTLLLRGINQNGNYTVVVAHYSQMVAHAIYAPKRRPERVITGFWTSKET